MKVEFKENTGLITCILFVSMFFITVWFNLISVKSQHVEEITITPEPDLSKILPDGTLNWEKVGNNWVEVTYMSGFKTFCLLYNSQTNQMTKLYDGACGNIEPKYEAEVKITSDDVLNAIAGKKLMFLTKKQVYKND
jgi:hypothetical protein